MYSFVGIEFNASQKSQVFDFQQRLREAVSSNGYRWTPSGNFHLTLFYLGATSVSLLPRIEAALERVARAHEPLSLRFDKPGAFPTDKHPRVFFLGVAENDRLNSLRQEIVEALLGFDFHADHPDFRPHVTVARRSLRNAKSRGTPGAHLRQALPVPPEMVIEEIALFQSLHRNNTTVYEVLRRLPLSG